MSEEWGDRCPDENCKGPIITKEPEVVTDSVGRKSVRHVQYCMWCNMEHELPVEQFCPCCETYLGD